MRNFNLTIKQLAQLAELLIREKFLISDEHSLAELEAMGHPYSRRAPQSIHRPPWKVHIQSGELAAHFKMKGAEYTDSQIRIKVGFDASSPDHVFWVLFGTEKMVPRDFLALGFARIRPQLDAIVKTTMVMPKFQSPIRYKRVR